MTELNNHGNQGQLNRFDKMNQFDQTGSTVTNVFIVGGVPQNDRVPAERLKHDRVRLPGTGYVQEYGKDYLYPAFLSSVITGVAAAGVFLKWGDDYDQSSHLVWTGVTLVAGFLSNITTAFAIDKNSKLAIGASTVVGAAVGAAAICHGLNVESHRSSSLGDNEAHNKMMTQRQMQASADSLTRAAQRDAKTIHLHDARKKHRHKSTHEHHNPQ